MFFWTWAKGLEDSFDSKNRQNLKSFISTGSVEDIVHQLNVEAAESEASFSRDETQFTPDPTLYYVSRRSPHDHSSSVESFNEKDAEDE